MIHDQKWGWKMIFSNLCDFFWKNNDISTYASPKWMIFGGQFYLHLIFTLLNFWSHRAYVGKKNA